MQSKWIHSYSACKLVSELYRVCAVLFLAHSNNEIGYLFPLRIYSTHYPGSDNLCLSLQRSIPQIAIDDLGHLRRWCKPILFESRQPSKSAVAEAPRGHAELRALESWTGAILQSHARYLQASAIGIIIGSSLLSEAFRSAFIAILGP